MDTLYSAMWQVHYDTLYSPLWQVCCEHPVLTDVAGVPLRMTASAKRTRDGLLLRRAFLAAVSSADFRPHYRNKHS